MKALYMLVCLAGLVLAPPGHAANIVDTTKAAGTFGGLMESLRESGMDQTLTQAGPYTIFAPSDEAFSKMPAEERDALRHDKQHLKVVMEMHIVRGTVLFADTKQGQRVTSLSGQPLTLHKVGNAWLVEGATVLEPDVKVDNGVIHVIDTVLLPKK